MKFTKAAPGLTVGLALFSLFAMLGSPAHAKSASALQNPSQLFPGQVAFYDASGGGSTLYVSLQTAGGLPILLTDSAGVNWSGVSVTIPTSTALGLGFALTQTKPDGTHYLSTNLSNSAQYRITVTVHSGAVTYNGGGMSTGAAGAGNGIATGSVPPGAYDSPLSAGGTYILDPTGVRVLAAAGGSQVVAGPTGGSLADGSGSVVSGGLSQTLFPPNPSRHYLLIVNNSPDVLWINFTTTAAAAQPSIQIQANGGSFLMTGAAVSTEAVSIIGATTGDSFTAKQL